MLPKANSLNKPDEKGHMFVSCIYTTCRLQLGTAWTTEGSFLGVVQLQDIEPKIVFEKDNPGTE